MHGRVKSTWFVARLGFVVVLLGVGLLGIGNPLPIVRFPGFVLVSIAAPYVIARTVGVWRSREPRIGVDGDRVWCSFATLDSPRELSSRTVVRVEAWPDWPAVCMRTATARRMVIPWLWVSEWAGGMDVTTAAIEMARLLDVPCDLVSGWRRVRATRRVFTPW